MDSSYNLYYPEGATGLDGIPEDEVGMFNEHWKNFPPQHPLILHVVGIAFFLLWTVNFVGNGCIIYTFLKAKSLRTPSNMFVINLAISDICMMTSMGLPVTINAYTKRYWMWGSLACQVYGCIGAIFGTCSIMTMVVIGYDRYNVIVRGFSGKKITPGLAFIIVIACWVYSVLCSIPPFFGWGGYTPEGLLVTCGYDYLSQDWNSRSFLGYAIVFNYTVPLFLILCFYVQIVKAVVAHEAALRAQAKKMNVESLRSNAKETDDSAEVKIAKVAITNVMLWFTTWTPYCIVNGIGSFGLVHLVTPLVSQIPSFLAKTACCFNPIVYGVAHPKFREAMTIHLPCFGIKESGSQSTEAEISMKTETC